MKKQILVTGGAGYIGSHTVLALLENGYEPIIFDNFSNSNGAVIDRLALISGARIPVVTGDCCCLIDLQMVFKCFPNISGVIHFAAHKSVAESVANPMKYYSNNIVSLTNVMKLCRDHLIRNIVFSSSAAVYGESDQSPIVETQGMGKPASPYALTKQFGERVLEMAVEGGDGIKALGLRYFNPVGAHPSGLIGEDPLGPPANLVPVLMDAVTGRRPSLQVFGTDYDTRDGSCIRDYLHVSDLADAHVCALNHLFQTSETNYWNVFNIGTGRGSTVFEIIEAFEAVTNMKVPILPAGRREGDLREVYADVTKAKTILGWKASRSLALALEDGWRWHLQAQNGTTVPERGNGGNVSVA